MILELKNAFIGKAVNKAQQTSFTSPGRPPQVPPQAQGVPGVRQGGRVAGSESPRDGWF